MTIMQLTAHFRPNVGGVETHLNDLVNALINRSYSVVVLTYRPLTTKAKWKIYEKDGNLEILRIPYFPNLFYKLISFPSLEFIYLLPGLFLVSPIVILWKRPDVIHTHGLIAGFVGVFWGKIFKKRVIVTTHSIYSFPNRGLYKNFAKWIFNSASFCLGLSKQSAGEIKSLGISTKKIGTFTYWIDLNNFQKIKNAKRILGWDNKFVVLFAGRLIKEKGLNVLLDVAKNWEKEINLKIIGNGPMEGLVKVVASKLSNVEYIGSISQSELPLYYSGSDILIVPSITEEGFGRVILESLSCGTPVIGANKGAIPEAINKTVGKLIDIDPQNIKQEIEYFYNHQDKLIKLAKNCRRFAERRYSEKNIESIIRLYK